MATAVILGAGFSKCAGLPLVNEFPNYLLNEDIFNSKIDVVITNILNNFLKRVFLWSHSGKLPSLEDIFTMIDLSANSGHNLGLKYAPNKLRAIRRLLIYRIFSILDYKYNQSKEISEFLSYYCNINNKNISFIVLNWDIVLEKHLKYLFPNVIIDYYTPCKHWSNDNEREVIRKPLSIKIAKVHGSSNWVYCDNCRILYYDLKDKLSLRIHAGLIQTDFRLFGKKFNKKEFSHLLGISQKDRKCPECKIFVGPHIATFSYRKSFRTHAFTNSWQGAEEILMKSDEWIFIGYSLPEADYEFKHLLKTAQIKKGNTKNPSKKIVAIVKNDPVAISKYSSFFGPSVVKPHENGLKGYIKYLKS